MLTAYMDESYNNRTMCIGGWLCHERVWPLLEHAWQMRILYENRISQRKGLKQLSRYHAADCASCVNEFKGWPVDRQIRLTKKLIEIIAKYKPVAFVFGATRKELISTFKELNDENWKHCSYYMCMLMCLLAICEYIHKEMPRERVTVIHDHGPFNSAAQLALNSARGSVNNSGHIVTVAPMQWRDRVALQPADFIAYEGYKLVEAHKNGQEFRRSLQRMMGKPIPIAAGYTKPEFLALFRKEVDE